MWRQLILKAQEKARYANKEKDGEGKLYQKKREKETKKKGG